MPDDVLAKWYNGDNVEDGFSGEVAVERIREDLFSLAPGVIEMYVHPGDLSLDPETPGLSKIVPRQRDMEIMQSDAMRELLFETQGVVLMEWLKAMDSSE